MTHAYRNNSSCNSTSRLKRKYRQNKRKNGFILEKVCFYFIQMFFKIKVRCLIHSKNVKIKGRKTPIMFQYSNKTNLECMKQIYLLMKLLAARHFDFENEASKNIFETIEWHEKEIKKALRKYKVCIAVKSCAKKF